MNAVTSSLPFCSGPKVSRAGRTRARRRGLCKERRKGRTWSTPPIFATQRSGHASALFRVRGNEGQAPNGHRTPSITACGPRRKLRAFPSRRESPGKIIASLSGRDETIPKTKVCERNKVLRSSDPSRSLPLEDGPL